MEIKELQRLAEIKFTIGSLEAEAKEIQAKALQEMRDSNTEEIVAEGLGKLVLASKSKWSYPQEIVEAETQLKANKKAAEQGGTATNNPTFYTRWIPEGDKEEAPK